MEEIKKFLQQIMHRVDGLYYIVISDKDGVPFIKMSSQNAPDIGSRLYLFSNFGIVAEQASKLDVGRTISITSVHSNYQVVQIYSLPLTITFVADADANTGYIQSLESQLEPLLIDLKEIVHERHEMK
ncbi:ragulator complex protein LAMTOR3-A [Planococcus citri]|uniref:ragulator complex protein LAMTOR3-A n=1 Tax=Planococcus citri TaxID=170843 RepID=UPI0031F81C6A